MNMKQRADWVGLATIFILAWVPGDWHLLALVGVVFGVAFKE